MWFSLTCLQIEDSGMTWDFGLRQIAIFAAYCAAAMLTASPALTMGSDPPPKPKIDCKKKKNKDKPQCKKNNKTQLSDDELYYTGYWLARAGKFAEARKFFLQAKDQNNPRILNYLGFTARKLGDVQKALPYYQKALRINPDYTVARAYLGEAYLQLGTPAEARAQLAEIEKRCGRACREYAELAGHIERYDSKQPLPGKTG